MSNGKAFAFEAKNLIFSSKLAISSVDTKTCSMAYFTNKMDVAPSLLFDNVDNFYRRGNFVEQ